MSPVIATCKTYGVSTCCGLCSTEFVSTFCVSPLVPTCTLLTFVSTCTSISWLFFVCTCSSFSLCVSTHSALSVALTVCVSGCDTAGCTTVSSSLLLVLFAELLTGIGHGGHLGCVFSSPNRN